MLVVRFHVAMTYDTTQRVRSLDSSLHNSHLVESFAQVEVSVAAVAG